MFRRKERLDFKLITMALTYQPYKGHVTHEFGLDKNFQEKSYTQSKSVLRNSSLLSSENHVIVLGRKRSEPLNEPGLNRCQKSVEL